MTEEPQTVTAAEAEVTERPLASWAPEPPAAPAAAQAAIGAAAVPSDRPEVLVGAAFVLGLATALILKRLAR